MDRRDFLKKTSAVIAPTGAAKSSKATKSLTIKAPKGKR